MFRKKIKKTDMEKVDLLSESTNESHLKKKLRAKIKEKLSSLKRKTKDKGKKILSKGEKVATKIKDIPDKFKSVFKYNLDDSFIYGEKQNKLIIFFLLLCVWFVLDCIYDYINYIKSLALNDFIGLLIAVVSFTVISLLVYFLVNDILGIVTLNKQQRLREKINTLIKQRKINDLKNLLINNKLTSAKQKKQLKEDFLNIHNGTDVVAHYEEVVLSSIDKKVDKIIRNYAISSSLANIASNKSFLNFFVTFIIFIKMVLDIAKTYKLKLGICTFVRILIIGLLGSSFSTSFIKIIESVTDNKIVNVMKDIFIPNIVIRQLGIKVKYAIRPIAPRNNLMFKESIEKIADNKGEN